jgi:hypothetical protein
LLQLALVRRVLMERQAVVVVQAVCCLTTIMLLQLDHH